MIVGGDSVLVLVGSSLVLVGSSFVFVFSFSLLMMLLMNTVSRWFSSVFREMSFEQTLNAHFNKLLTVDVFQMVVHVHSS